MSSTTTTATTSTGTGTGTGTGTTSSTGASTPVDAPARRVAVAVAAGAEQVWQALVDGDRTPGYYFGFRAEYGDLTVGTGYRYTAGGGDVITGTLLEVEPGRRLVVSFDGHWSPAVAALPSSTVTFVVDADSAPVPGVTLLTCVHEGLADSPTAVDLERGWVAILSGLKTLVETGRPMAPPPA